MSKINSPNLRLTILGLSLILVMSCSKTNKSNNQNTADNVLHINLPDKKSDELCKASTIADTIIYVPLETNSKSIFGKISSIAINDSFIVIAPNMLVFRRNSGRFVRKIGKTGHGPGEFIHVNNFILKEDTLFITSVGKRGIDKYTIGGKYLGFIKQEFEMQYYSEMPDEGYAWYDINHGNVVFFNDKWKITDTLSVELNVSKFRQLRSWFVTDNQYFVKTPKNLLFKDYLNDTIWDISMHKKKPAIIFNLKEKLLPSNLRAENFSPNEYKTMLEKMKPYQRINILPTDSFFFVIQRSWSDFSMPRILFGYNRISKDIKQYGRDVIYDDIVGNIRLGIFFYFDNTIFSLIDYNDIKNAYEKATEPKVKEFWAKLYKGAKEDDNDVLVIIKTK